MYCQKPEITGVLSLKHRTTETGRNAKSSATPFQRDHRPSGTQTYRASCRKSRSIFVNSSGVGTADLCVVKWEGTEISRRQPRPHVKRCLYWDGDDGANHDGDSRLYLASPPKEGSERFVRPPRRKPDGSFERSDSTETPLAFRADLWYTVLENNERRNALWQSRR